MGFAQPSFPPISVPRIHELATWHDFLLPCPISKYSLKSISHLFTFNFNRNSMLLAKKKSITIIAMNKVLCFTMELRKRTLSGSSLAILNVGVHDVLYRGGRTFSLLRLVYSSSRINNRPVNKEVPLLSPSLCIHWMLHIGKHNRALLSQNLNTKFW